MCASRVRKWILAEGRLLAAMRGKERSVGTAEALHGMACSLYFPKGKGIVDRDAV